MAYTLGRYMPLFAAGYIIPGGRGDGRWAAKSNPTWPFGGGELAEEGVPEQWVDIHTGAEAKRLQAIIRTLKSY